MPFEANYFVHGAVCFHAAPIFYHYGALDHPQLGTGDTDSDTMNIINQTEAERNCSKLHQKEN